jgi:hypothetical protein
MQLAEGVISNSRDGTDAGVWNEQNNNRIIQILTSAPSGAVYYYFTYKPANTSARVGSYITSIFTSSSKNNVLKKTFSWRLHIIDRLGKNVIPVELKINPTKVDTSFKMKIDGTTKDVDEYLVDKYCSRYGKCTLILYTYDVLQRLIKNDTSKKSPVSIVSMSTAGGRYYKKSKTSKRKMQSRGKPRSKRTRRHR